MDLVPRVPDRNQHIITGTYALPGRVTDLPGRAQVPLFVKNTVLLGSLPPKLKTLSVCLTQPRPLYTEPTKYIYLIFM